MRQVTTSSAPLRLSQPIPGRVSAWNRSREFRPRSRLGDPFSESSGARSQLQRCTERFTYCLSEAWPFEEAALVWEATLADPAATHQDVDGIAELNLYLGHDQRYRHVCQVMLNRFEHSTDALVCERLGRACLLKPTTPEITARATALIDRALTTLTPEQEWGRPYIQFAKALSAYRTGRFQEAVNLLAQDTANVLPPGPDLVLSMALFELNQTDAAKQALARAEVVLDEDKSVVTRERWLFEILRREAISRSTSPKSTGVVEAGE